VLYVVIRNDEDLSEVQLVDYEMSEPQHISKWELKACRNSSDYATWSRSETYCRLLVIIIRLPF